MAKDYGIKTKFNGTIDLDSNNNWVVKDLEKHNETVLFVSKLSNRVHHNIDAKGAVTQVSTYSANENVKNEKPITANGIEMGAQDFEAGVIPIVYGHIGMTGTQFNKGQTPSDIDSEKTRQTLRFPISEGPIVGLSYQASGTVITDSNIYITPELDNPQHAKALVIDQIQVVDPEDDKAKFGDIKLELTKGDGTTATYQSFEITEFEPIITNPDTGALDVPIEKEEDKTYLNDLSD
ncbi:uncharacterized protein METZ01_LOCUS154306, partial [marine metagenome]